MVLPLVAVLSSLVGLFAGLVIGGRAGWLALRIAGRIISQPREAVGHKHPEGLRRVA